MNKLFSAGMDMKIHEYDVTTFKTVPHKEDILSDADDDGNRTKPDERKHTKCITDLLPIPDLGLIASCSLDATMILWKMDGLVFKSKHTCHTKGIYCLEWIDDNKLILSAGFDHDIFIWNPIVTEKIFTLKGHNHSMVGVKWLKGTN